MPRGIVKKASMVTAGRVSLNTAAVKAILEVEQSLRRVRKYGA